MLYRAGDGADQTLEKESRAVRASPAFSQICAALEIDRRPISDPGGPAGHPLPSIRLKIIDRASHVPRGRIEDQEHWTNLGRGRGKRISAKRGSRGLLERCINIGNCLWSNEILKKRRRKIVENRRRQRKKSEVGKKRGTRAFPGLGEISFDPIMPAA